MIAATMVASHVLLHSMFCVESRFGVAVLIPIYACAAILCAFSCPDASPAAADCRHAYGRRCDGLRYKHVSVGSVIFSSDWCCVS